MTWWVMAAQAAQAYSPWALNAKAESAYAASFNANSAKEAQKYNTADNFRNNEKNLARVEQDRQVELTAARTTQAEQEADVAVQAAASGVTGSFKDVANLSVHHATEKAIENINMEYGSRLVQTKSALQASMYDFYSLNAPYRPKYKKVTDPILGDVF